MQKLIKKLKNIDKIALKKNAIILAVELLIVGVLVAIDLISKHFVFEALDAEHKTLTIIDGFLYFETHRNTGAAFSVLSGHALELGILSLFVTLFILCLQFFSLYFSNNAWLRTGIVLLLAGAIGNMVDRFALGYVRDFVDLGWIFDWVGVFNFADSCMTVSLVILLVYVIFFFSKDDKAYDLNKKKPQENPTQSPDATEDKPDGQD